MNLDLGEMAHAAAYVPIALSFLVLIVWLIFHFSPVPIDRAETEERGLRLLRSHIADTDGAVVFRQVCVMGLEGIVAKRRDSRYRSGRCREWIKVKNRAHPAFERAMLIALSKRTGSRSR